MSYLRKILSYIAGRMLLISFCAALVITCFYMALNMANIYIVITDGMEDRASMILTRDSKTDLDNYFRSEFLAEDGTLRVALSSSSPWTDYSITGYSYNCRISWMWTWPWEDVATATIMETVDDIAGYAVASSQSLVNSGAISPTPPKWQGGEYTVTLTRVDGRWRIAGLRQTRVILPPTPAPTKG